jgi:hypothetical protein
MYSALRARFERATAWTPYLLRLICGLLFAQALAGCGGGGTDDASAVPGSFSAPATAHISVSVAGAPVSMTTGETSDLAPLVTVSGNTNTTVSWAVQEGAAGGSISSAGVYTSPAMFGTDHVVVTSQADNAVTATIPIIVGPVTVTIVPPIDTLGPGGVRPFTAITSAIDQRVIWTVLEGAAGGSISGNRYTAPNSTGTFHVIGSSVRDSTASASAALTVVASGFRPAKDMLKPRSAHTATRLLNGNVLIAGGGEFNTDCSNSFDYGPEPCPLADAELYDPASGTFSSTGKMVSSLSGHTATLLPNGKVLLISGGGDTRSGSGNNAELYDPGTGLFATTGSLTQIRFSPTATLLADGQVLVAGGIGNNTTLATAELYDPQTEAFTATGGTGMTMPRRGHTATRLADGRVLITGGYSGNSATSTAELYDPITRTFTATAIMGTARSGHRATLLANGTVLITGGSGSGGSLNSAEIYDPASGRFSAAGNMTTTRSSHIAVALPDGKVLVVGGDCSSPNSRCYSDTGYSFTAEIYDPATGSFTQTGSLAAGLIDPAAVLLDDGRVLVTGGSDFASAELYR